MKKWAILNYAQLNVNIYSFGCAKVTLRKKRRFVSGQGQGRSCGRLREENEGGRTRFPSVRHGFGEREQKRSAGCSSY